jgi:hypothetical protein
MTRQHFHKNQGHVWAAKPSSSPPAAGGGDDRRPPETPREKFRRLVEKRVSKILEGIKRISNLLNKNQYEYSEDDIREIKQVLHDAVDRTFQGGFKLKTAPERG